MPALSAAGYETRVVDVNDPAQFAVIDRTMAMSPGWRRMVGERLSEAA